LADLHQEYAIYKSEITGTELNDVALRDDNEYLIGENKDLHLKVKEICLQNANLKALLAHTQTKKLEQAVTFGEEGTVGAANDLIETARNLSDVDSGDEEVKETTDFISEQDFFRQVMISNTQEETELTRQLGEAQTLILDLQEKLSLQEQTEDDSTAIQHIKGTLIQFLKSTPLTEKQNEELLKIIYSMMEFSPAEV
jgi:hypothetical protein